MMQDHWIIVTIGLTNAMADYFIFNDMSNGLDMTMEFDWIKNKTHYLPVLDTSKAHSSLNIVTNL